MSEHAGVARTPGVVESTQRQRAGAVREDGGDWPLAAVFFTAVVGLYAATAGAIYGLVTSVSWQLLAAGGLVVLTINFALLFALVVREFRLQRAQLRTDKLAERRE